MVQRIQRGRAAALGAVLLAGCIHRGAHPLVGVASGDWLLAPPDGLSPRGERVLGDGPEDGPWGLVLGSSGGREVVVLDRAVVDAAGTTSFVVDAVLVLPRGTERLGVAWECRVDGRDDPFVVGTIAPRTSCDPPQVEAVAAWRVVAAERRFEAIPVEAVTCAPFACEGEGDLLLELGTPATLVEP